jgi:DinB family protein
MRSRTTACAPGPAAGEWAIIEVVSHLADTEERALARVRRMLAEDNPPLEPFDQEALAEQRRYLHLDLEGSWAAWNSCAASTSPSWKRSTGRGGSAPGGTGNTAS